MGLFNSLYEHFRSKGWKELKDELEVTERT
ncbi:MAG: hypothetical protein JWL69_298 [Phycisphaerales bacterium]|nr:hypothetical protein [Phycisphaerales bacterium]MDB5357649.1 hypothetical protein [Phycisphaerales bacterium]